MSSSKKKRSRKQRRARNLARQLGRRWVLSMLYGIDFTDQPPDAALRNLQQLVPQATDQEQAFAFAEALLRELLPKRADVDAVIQTSSPRWTLSRMDCIDRNILRLATFELVHRPEVPPRVVINEAIELAKSYGAEKTRSFVNGILQQICSDNDIAL